MNGTYLKGFHHGRTHPSGDVSTGEELAENLIRHSVLPFLIHKPQGFDNDPCLKIMTMYLYFNRTLGTHVQKATVDGVMAENLLKVRMRTHLS